VSAPERRPDGGEVSGAGPFITIFIPTYNRADTLDRALESVERQTDRDLEAVMVDDGSTDETPALVQRWIARNPFPIRYVRQPNQGKHVAHNTALDHATGELFMTLDSDDSLLPDAVEKIRRHWQAIPDEERAGFAGVAGMCLNEDGTLSGEPYPEPVIDSDHLEIFTRCRMNGERREALRVDVLREYPYPRFDGERFVRPTLILRRMAHRYRIRFTNEVLQVNRHAARGITNRIFEFRTRNPRGLRLCFLEEINLHDRYKPWRKLFQHHVRYVRYSLHSGVGLLRQAREVKHRGTWLVAVPEGLFSWVADRYRLRFHGGRHAHRRTRKTPWR
jgi:glycosyltransferase involved in cell wall biosynthesis